jgi:tetratricopeptide (TPR) repeat protein
VHLPRIGQRAGASVLNSPGNSADDAADMMRFSRQRTRGNAGRVGTLAAALALALLAGPAGAAPPRSEAPAPGFQAPLGPDTSPSSGQAKKLEAGRKARPEAGAPRRRLADVPEVQRAAEPVRRLAERLRAPETRRGALLMLLAALGGLIAGPLLLFVGIPLLRGRGDLAVHLAYPDELEGTFRVRVSRRRPRQRRPTRGAEPVADLGLDRAATRTDHPMVSRETRFQRLRAGHWWVRAEGVLQDPESDEVLESRFAEERVRVRRGKTARLSFELRPEHCPVDVKVLWDKRPVREARVALRGTPYSVRFAKAGAVRLRLPRGTHALVAGSADRVAERAVDVNSWRTTWVIIDLGGSDELIFKGCPGAVEPYLQGDFAGAVRALERAGQAKVAHVLLARLDQEQGRTAAAAEHWEAADRLVEAAELRAALGEFERAALLFDRAGTLLRAAEMYQAAGESAAAGGAYERAGDWARAAACYREAGETAHLAGALENLGSYFEAAELCLAASDWTRAIRNLQHVPPGDARYAESCRMLADAYERIGDPELALRKLEEAVRVAGGDGAPLDLQARLAEALERGGEMERALSLYEQIHQRDAAFPDVRTRIEALRKKRSAERAHARTAPLAGFDAPGFSRYEIIEEIGRGGMGVVYKARDRRLGRVVALKKLPENLRDHPKAVELFLREARAAASLNHPNIVTLYDADEEGGTFFFTMELLEGQNLYAILRKVERVRPRDVARLGVQAATGLAYAHERRIVHRDIKTANLFFTKDKVLKIMDFGLAKMVEEVRRAITVVAGTPYYMAPEQSAGESVDHRADLYALGVTFFELVTGRLPFEEGDVAFHHRNTPPPDPRDRFAEVPPVLARLILELMAKDPAARPASGEAVAARLQTFLSDRP